MKSFFLLSVFLTSAYASGITPALLFRRQGSECDPGYTVCGQVCIISGYTCCPDQSGGCPPSENCQLGTNNEYGCCPKGETCVGTGGATTDTAYVTSSYTTTSRISTTVRTSPTAVITGSSSTCDAGEKACGDVCIPTTYECCPDYSGGCDPNVARCWLGTNGAYGCCANQYSSCSGDAGPATTLFSTNSDVIVSSTTTTPRTSSHASSTQTPASVSTSTHIASSSTSSRTSSASTSSASAAQLSSGGQQNNGLLASLLSLVMAVLALVI